MSATVLRATNLTKTYDDVAVLDGVTVALRAGQSLAITGRSGSGKSTLLQCLAGITDPDQGDVTLETAAVQGSLQSMSTAARTALRGTTFGLVFQQGLLLPELTAVENVLLPLLVNGWKRASAHTRAYEALLAVGLDRVAERRTAQLSGGEQQRVAVARSQVLDPVVTFADEPTGSLDERTADAVFGHLLRNTTERGRSLVVVTHDQRVAERCTRAVRLVRGQLHAPDALVAAQ